MQMRMISLGFALPALLVVNFACDGFRTTNDNTLPTADGTFVGGDGGQDDAPGPSDDDPVDTGDGFEDGSEAGDGVDAGDEGDGLDGAAQTPVVAPFLPGDIELDIGELPEDEEGEPAEDLPAGSPARLIYERIVLASATVVHRFHHLANRALALGAAMRADFSDPEQTQVEGTFATEGREIVYKAEFAAFDVDGDEVPDGTGTATEFPVAVRIWTDRGNGFERFLCAVVSERPSSANVGAGELYIRPAAVVSSASEDVQIRVTYDRTNPAHQWNQAYVTGRIHPSYLVSTGLARVDVRSSAGDGVNLVGDSGVTEKTVRSACEFAENVHGFETFQAALHYRRGGEGLLLSAASLGAPWYLGFTDVCVNLATQAAANNGECDDFDTQDMDLLDVPTGDETQFPADFPEEPTF